MENGHTQEYVPDVTAIENFTACLIKSTAETFVFPSRCVP